MGSRRWRGGRAFAPAAQGLVEFTGYTNTDLFTGQTLGPDLDRLRLIGAPTAVVYCIIISAPAIKMFIRIVGAALPLVCRESFDTLQDPLRFSVVPIAVIGRPRGPIRAIRRRHRRHAARVAAMIGFAAKRVKIWIRRRERLLIEDELAGVSVPGLL